MDLKQELIDRLGVPENWDKYDYQTQRYSFDDMQEVLDDIVKKLTIPVVVGQSEQFNCGKQRVYGEERCKMQCNDCVKEYGDN